MATDKRRDFDDQENLDSMAKARTDVEWGPADEEPTPQPEVKE